MHLRRGGDVITRAPLPESLVATRVMAILRAPDAATLVPVAGLLARGGIRCLEVAMTGTGALAAVSRLRADLPPEVSVGAGSVLSADQARAAVDAGAEFLVSPCTDADVIGVALGAGLAVYPGAWTATEVVNAWRLGATAVKVFPASSGGPDHFRQLAAPLPDIPLLAVGGVTLADAGDFLDAGAVGVGLGSALLRGVDSSDADAVAARVHQLLRAVHAQGVVRQ